MSCPSRNFDLETINGLPHGILRKIEEPVPLFRVYGLGFKEMSFKGFFLVSYQMLICS
jgi:hypothetical protein